MLLGEDLLDDAEALEAADTGELLRGVAAAPARLRESLFLAADAGVPRVAEDGRPRALVVAGDAEAVAAGDLLAELAATAGPVPVVVHRGEGLPGWIGAADLVFVASVSPDRQGALAVADAAARRNARLVSAGLPDSPLADITARAHGIHVAVPAGRAPGGRLWSYAGPLLVAASALGVSAFPEAAGDRLATRLDELTERYKPSRDVFVNPAKSLALTLAEHPAVIVGTGPVAAAAARRLAARAWSLAARPVAVVTGGEALLPRALKAPGGGPAYAVVVLREQRSSETDDAVTELRQRAREAGVPFEAFEPDSDEPLDVVASHVALGDFAAAYLALAVGLG